MTEVASFDEFYVAEDYHQDYFRNNGFQPYCQVIIAPKVAKFRSSTSNGSRRSLRQPVSISAG